MPLADCISVKKKVIGLWIKQKYAGKYADPEDVNQLLGFRAALLIFKSSYQPYKTRERKTKHNNGKKHSITLF